MLPSTRRPKEVEEERAARLQEQQRLWEQQRRDALKIRISKVEIFRGTMANWYSNLKHKEKKRLTDKQLKREALFVCNKYDMVYENLPDDWVHELQTKHKMKLYKKSKAVGASVQQPVMEPIVRYNPREKRHVQQAVRFQYDPGNVRQKTPGPSTSNTVVQAVDQQVPVLKPDLNKKKWVDYTNDPPPPAWTKSYAEGTVLPRVLTVYSREDANMIFYDYNPKLVDLEGNKVELIPQPRINTEHFDSLFDSKFERPIVRKRRILGRKKFHGKPKYPVVYEN